MLHCICGHRCLTNSRAKCAMPTKFAFRTRACASGAPRMHETRRNRLPQQRVQTRPVGTAQVIRNKAIVSKTRVTSRSWRDIVPRRASYVKAVAVTPITRLITTRVAPRTTVRPCPVHFEDKFRLSVLRFVFLTFCVPAAKRRQKSLRIAY